MTRHYSDNFTRRGRGGLILLGSLVGYQGVARAATYAATKARVQTLAEGLHLELRPLGIDVLSVAPGPRTQRLRRQRRHDHEPSPAPRRHRRPGPGRPWPPDHHRPRSTVKLLTWSLTPLPRKARTLIMSRVMAEMTPTTPSPFPAPPTAG